jgi:transcriptional regulator with XRE-family HTH domain
MDETLGGRIRQAREDYGMSQAVLAKTIGLSKTTMNQIEKGHTRDPGASRIRAIAQTLQVTSDYLLGLAPNTACTTCATCARARALYARE